MEEEDNIDKKEETSIGLGESIFNKELNIPTNAVGLVQKKEEKEGDQNTTEAQNIDSNLVELEKKFDNKEDLLEEEIKLLVEKGIIKENKEESDVATKIKQLEAKKTEELTEEDKKFIQDNKKEDQSENLVTDVINYYTEKGISFEDNEVEEFKKNPDDIFTINEKVSQKLFENKLVDHIKSSPDFAKFYKHTVIDGKSFDSFLEINKPLSYDKLEVKEVSDSLSEEENDRIKENQKDVIRTYLGLNSLDKEVIEGALEKFELDDLLYKKAKDYKELLVESEKKQKEEINLKEEARIKAEQEQIQAEWQEIENILKSNDLGSGLKIPSSDLNNFQKAVLNPVDDKGHTQLDYLRAKLSTGEKLFLDYIAFKGFKVDGLTKTPANKSNIAQKYIKAKEENNKREAQKVLDGNRNSENNSGFQFSLKNIDFNNLVEN